MAGLLLGAACLVPRGGMAQVAGDCGTCHTMHNSQGGVSMSGTTTVYRALTMGNCVGCHTGGPGQTISGGTIPLVNHTSPPTAGTLAGGSFGYMGAGGSAATDALGHNVAGISTTFDSVLGITPPGGTALTGGPMMTCAGTNGCHGNRGVADEYADISGAHHGKNTSGGTNGYVDGNGLANSYRFLAGIKGLEDTDWEASNSSTDHNVYFGVDRATQTDSTTAAGSISTLCGKCHGAFHVSAPHVANNLGISYANNMTSPWVRHPTDFDMNNVKAKLDYAGYGGIGNPYVVQAPVASKNVSSTSTRVASVYGVAGDAIVTCVSCHRAHGSDQADLLRWDYTKMDAHASTVGETGCFTCHTTKDS